MLIILAYVLLGAVAGLIAGVFGLGGGIIIVPTLIFTFSYLNFPPEVLTHLAVGTSLSTIIFTSLSAISVHQKKSIINWSLAFKLIIGLVLGSFVGAYFANYFSGSLLQQIFALYSLSVAVQMWFSWRPKGAFILPKKVGLSLIGALIGIISGLFGIGGGTVTVPLLILYRVKITQAIATAAVVTFPVALSGTIGYIAMGLGNKNLPEYSLGYIYLPATLGIIITSTLFAKVGARLAHRLAPENLKKIFSFVLLLVSCRLFF